VCHCLTLASTDQVLETEATAVTHLRLDGPLPVLESGGEKFAIPEVGGLVESWGTVLEMLLQLWV